MELLMSRQLPDSYVTRGGGPPATSRDVGSRSRVVEQRADMPRVQCLLLSLCDMHPAEPCGLAGQVFVTASGGTFQYLGLNVPVSLLADKRESRVCVCDEPQRLVEIAPSGSGRPASIP
jgi:hypothetical protein